MCGAFSGTVNIRLYALQLYDMSYNWGIFLARGRTRTQYSTVCRRPSRPRASHWSDPADVATQSATIQQPGQLTKCARVSYKRILTVEWGSLSPSPSVATCGHALDSSCGTIRGRRTHSRWSASAAPSHTQQARQSIVVHVGVATGHASSWFGSCCGRAVDIDNAAFTSYALQVA